MSTVISQQKTQISQLLFSTLGNIDGVLSTTIVGSFNDQKELLVISDIDTIVIVDTLDKSIFDTCIHAIQALPGAAFGFPEREVFVNSTFGPLKFDTDSNIVVHLMIYDRNGHRQHVINSPFTCYDWERSMLYHGLHLSELYPVIQLQPRDFTGARRGIQNYLQDLDAGVISYRKYHFEGPEVTEITCDHTLDERHKGEYAYHIVKNLVINYCKLITRQNIFLDDEELEQLWKKYLPDCSYFIPTFRELAGIKQQRGTQFPATNVPKVKEFVNNFQQHIEMDWKEATTLTFVRHGKTADNDGSYLGQHRDPPLLEKPDAWEQSYDMVFSSPLLRARETAQAISGDKTVSIIPQLSEINYGKAEGLVYSELAEQFPHMIEGWSKGEDPHFPDGESTHEVLQRLLGFLSTLSTTKGHHLVVSHNVVLRCLVGYLFDSASGEWFKIPIPHLQPLEVLMLNGTFYTNFSKETKASIVDTLTFQNQP